MNDDDQRFMTRMHRVLLLVMFAGGWLGGTLVVAFNLPVSVQPIVFAICMVLVSLPLRRS